MTSVDTIRVQQADFSLQDEYDRLRSTTSGAIVTFSGLVRDFNDSPDAGAVDSLILQHYPGMTERLIAETVGEARKRWPLDRVTIIHRVGELRPADQIVLVAVSSSHRDAAFSAAQFLMDYLKTRATFWKKTRSGDREQWLDMKESDRDAARRWRRQQQQRDQ